MGFPWMMVKGFGRNGSEIFMLNIHVKHPTVFIVIREIPVRLCFGDQILQCNLVETQWIFTKSFKH